MKVKNVKLVTEEEYNNRLEKCRSCDHLEYGTTCKFCGCIIQIKAKLAGARCPYPYASPAGRHGTQYQNSPYRIY